DKYGMETPNFPQNNNFTLLYRIKIGDMTNASSDRHIHSTPGSHSCGVKLYGSIPESPGSPNDINGIDIEYIGYKPISSSDNWYHFAFVFGKDGYYFYKDGVLSGYATGYSYVQSGKFSFGYGGSEERIATPIQLDEIKIYDIALTAEQISEEYNYNKLLCKSDTWECGSWGGCSIDGSQTRACSMTYNCEYVDNPSPSTSQPCTPLCASESWSCSDWSPCSSSSNQTRTCNKTSNCQGGVSSPATSQSCSYVPQCTSYSWSCGNWTSCSSNGNQTRICSKNSNCEGGTPSPATTQSCSYAPACSADTWQCGSWGTCSPQGIQARSCNKTFDCSSVETASPATSQYCESAYKPDYQIPTQNSKITNQDSIIKSSVKLECPVTKYSKKIGSGTVINSSGLILTNKHVISDTAGCYVGFIDNYGSKPYFNAS
ncbi:hypothetical protein COV56_03100, partial [Candidatus Kuenenbacteria bacterium CG11_big_fil_rev_8_21_14_0_20_37_9]